MPRAWRQSSTCRFTRSTAAQSCATEAPVSDAAIVEAAQEWLALTDSGDWQASCDATGKAFRDVNTAESPAKAARQVRGRQGAFVSRSLLTVRYLNAPPRGYRDVAFSTRYANAPEPVIETVTLQREDGLWKTVGILID